MCVYHSGYLKKKPTKHILGNTTNFFQNQQRHTFLLRSYINVFFFVNFDKFLSQTPWIADKSLPAEGNDLSRPDQLGKLGEKKAKAETFWYLSLISNNHRSLTSSMLFPHLKYIFWSQLRKFCSYHASRFELCFCIIILSSNLFFLA